VHLGSVVAVTPPSARSNPVAEHAAPPELGPLVERGALPLEVTASIVGSYRWIERRLFEVYGGWVAHEAVAEARLFYDLQSQYHAWHAELWEERLPVLDGVDPDTLSIPPSVGVERLLTRVSGAPPAGDEADAPGVGPGGTLVRLVGMARVVLPRLVAGYTRHLARVVPVADGAVARTLELVRRDEVEAWQQAELQVQALVRRPSDVAVVTAHQRGLEDLVAEDGPGLVPWADDADPGA
jgi:hypothetical protein